MDVEMPTPGKYIVAVSGGVDSMALLHMLHAGSVEAGLHLVVAHFDHGVRPDSALDRESVAVGATEWHLPFVYEMAALGPNASEATARQARYAFLRKVQAEQGAKAIITAHHQDDVIETCIINMLRGGGRKSLTSLVSSPDLQRPLLSVPKHEIVRYAREHNLTWREDSTNQDDGYLRNYVRHHLAPKFGETNRAQLLNIVAKQHELNREIDSLLEPRLAPELERLWFNNLPHQVAKEVMASWLRTNNTRDFNKKSLDRLVIAAKISRPGKQIDILGTAKLAVGKQFLALKHVER